MPRARKILFQSTLPVRGGTLTRLAEVFEQEISIHPPRAGRDNRILKALAYINGTILICAMCGADSEPIGLPLTLIVISGTWLALFAKANGYLYE